MNRALFFYERFVFVGGRATWNGIGGVGLRGPIEEAALHHALSGVQATFGELRTGIQMRGDRPWFVTAEQPPPIPIRIATRPTADAWFEVMQAELERPFPTAEGPLARLVWIRPEAGTGETACELMLVAHHVICDGMSIMVIMRELLARLADPERPIVALPTRDSFDELPFGLQPGQDVLGRRGRATARALRLLLPLSGLLVRRRPRSPAYLLRWDLDEALTGSLASRSRVEGVSSYIAMCTAVLQAFRAVRAGRARNRLLATLDIRALLPGLGRDRLFPHSESVMLSLRPGDREGFWAQARALGVSFSDRRAKVQPVHRLVMAEQLHDVADRLIDLLMHGRVRQDVVFSYMGTPDLPEGQGPLAIAWMPTGIVSMPFRDGSALIAARTGGCLRFTLTSYPELLPQLEAGRIRDHAMALLADAVA